MALYWPEQKVALEIVDDPASQPVDRDALPDFTVIQVTCEQIEDPEANDAIARTLAHHLGTELPPDNPQWRARRRALHRTLFGGPSTLRNQK